MTLHPTVPNPYTLLSLFLPRTKVYTCLDLKDAFFCVCLAPASQPIFAFEWEDPVGGTKQQLTWTPPQGFKNFPTIFGKALASSSTPGNLLPSAAGAVLLSLPSIFPWSRGPAAGHPHIVGANIHTLPDGMSSGQKPRLPQRWLGSS